MMNMKKSLIVSIVALVVVGGGVYLEQKSEENAIKTFEECAKLYPVMESYPEQCRTPDGRTFVRDISSDLSNLIVIDAPIANATVATPLTVTGKARGNWYFEASFPVRLEDAMGNILATAPAQAQGDGSAGSPQGWMTTDFVPFKVTLAFKEPFTSTGELFLKNNNPSGDPMMDKEIRVPVVFREWSAFSFGKAATMAINDSVIFPDAGMLWLTAIEDSRCKPGVQCVWAGELAAIFSLGHAGIEPVVDQTIRLGTVNNKSVSTDKYVFTLESATETTATIIVAKTPTSQ